MNTRQAEERQALAAAMAAGMAMGRVTPSRLMSPVDLELATRGRPDLHGRLNGWCLCTEVPVEMWERALEAHVKGTAYQVMVAEAPTGRRYFVIVVPAEGWQHHVCVPLLGELTSQWLAVLSTRRLMTMSVACASSGRAFVAELEVPTEALAHLAGLNTRFRGDLVDFIEEACRLVAANAMGAIEVTQETAPCETSLSLALPAEVEAQLERRAKGRTQRKLS